MKYFIYKYEPVLAFVGVVLIGMIIASLGGCAAHTAPTKQVVPDGPVIANGAPIVLAGTPVEPVKNPVARRGTVYFDTASAEVPGDSTAALHKLARFLRGHPDVTVVLEGNCDERGSYAYNQRLGARRAESVAKVLIDSGVSAERVKTGSNGEFKPMLTCHEEKCWVMNRRVDVVYGGW